MTQILQYLQAQQDAMAQALAQLVALESPSSERQAVNKVVRFLEQAFETVDASMERLPQTAFGDHLRVSWGPGERQVLLLAHMDTVWPLEELKRRPYHVEGTRATGPGTFDMKGGIVIGLFAVRALHHLGLVPNHRLVFLFNSDEEVGSLTSRSHIEAEAKQSDAVIVLEPSREGSLVTWRKGVGHFTLEVQGLASHAGAAHEQGISAVQELAHHILRLESMTDYEVGSTVNVGVVHGGSVVNARPASAFAQIDLRVTTMKEAERMTEAILGLQPVNAQATLIASGGMNRPPWEHSPEGDTLFERARRVGKTLGLDLMPAGTGGGSDGNFTAALGVPTLDGLGIIGNDAHALTEWADITSMPRQAALLAELILDLGK